VEGRESEECKPMKEKKRTRKTFESAVCICRRRVTYQEREMPLEEKKLFVVLKEKGKLLVGQQRFSKESCDRVGVSKMPLEEIQTRWSTKESSKRRSKQGGPRLPRLAHKRGRLQANRTPVSLRDCPLPDRHLRTPKLSCQ